MSKPLVANHIPLFLLLSVCMFDKFHLMFNFKSKVSHDIFKNKNECHLTSTSSSKMLPQCHMPSSTCHFNLQSVNWCVVSSFTSHSTCQILNHACQLTCILFLCKSLCVKCQKLAKTLPNMHTASNVDWLCPKVSLDNDQVSATWGRWIW